MSHTESKSSKYYFYNVVRLDLSLPQQAVQAAHAACMAGEAYGRSVTSMVLLGIPDKASLEGLSKELESKGINFQMFFEPDWDTGHSALCTEPLKGKDRWRIKALLEKYGATLWSGKS